MPPISLNKLLWCDMKKNNILTLNNITINEITGMPINKTQEIIDYNTNTIYSYNINDNSIKETYFLSAQNYAKSKTFVRKESIETEEYVSMNKKEREILLTENEE